MTRHARAGATPFVSATPAVAGLGGHPFGFFADSREPYSVRSARAAERSRGNTGPGSGARSAQTEYGTASVGHGTAEAA